MKSALTFIYFVQVGEFVKIGKTENWKRCIRDIEKASPHEVKVLLLEIYTPNLEQKMHDRFEAHHHRGEWFRAVPALLAFIERRKRITPSMQAEKH